MAYIANGAPGVTFTEEDSINSIVSSGVSAGAIVGAFQWGPCYEPQEITSVSDLVNIFGYPTDTKYKDWFCARNFLSYSSNLYACRCITSSHKNACNVESAATLIKSHTDFINKYASLSTGNGSVYAKYPGTYGNNIQVILKQSNYSGNDSTSIPTVASEAFNLSYSGSTNDVFYCVLYDGEIVECKVYSLDKDATDVAGNSRYLWNAVNNNSDYVYLVKEKIITTAEDGTQNPIFLNVSLSGGYDGNTSTSGSTAEDTSGSSYDYASGWELFEDTETYNVGLLIQGESPLSALSTVIDSRKDCIACISLDSSVYTSSSSTTTSNTDIMSNISTAMTNFSGITNQSYLFLDGNYKYQYDSYNETYRWVPLNGDIAGIFAQVDDEKACWFSPGGYAIKNCIKLAWNPTKTNRDSLFNLRVNPVISKAQTGIVLWGDSTRASVNSSFNYVNIRRLFNYIEKNVLSYAENSILWQQNDEDTQELFYNTVEPFLREVQGGRGVEDYKMVCDSTVNTTDIRTAGKFVAKIYIKPIFSIRWIEITFISSKSDSVFTENSL